MAMYELDHEEVEELQSMMDQYGSSALKAINDVLHGEGGDLLKESIHNLIPASGRTWKGKRNAASQADSLKKDIDEMLEVTVRTKPDYHYLWFPDDGSDTMRHAGGQQFFQAGADEAAEKIIDMCLGKLIEEF